MLKSFNIFKSKPKIKIIVTRDSVCAGDDVDAPHEQSFTIPSFSNPLELVQQISSLYCLPSISGGQATWVCELNDISIAVLAQQWASPKALVKQIEYHKINQLHFTYHAQTPPEKYV